MDRIDITDQAQTALASLTNEADDDYSEHIRVVIAEREQKIAEQRYEAASLAELQTIFADASPDKPTTFAGHAREKWNQNQWWIGPVGLAMGIGGVVLALAG